MRDDLPPAWPPPWEMMVAAVLFIVATNALAQQAWEIALLGFSMAVVAAVSRHSIRWH